MVEHNIIIDIDHAITVEQLFRRAAHLLALRLNVEEEMLVRKLIDRERLCSTVVKSSIAIPHIVIEGHDVFEVIFIRCREGIYFSSSAPRVTIVFLFVVTCDEHNFYLNTLAAIAQIAQDPHFEERWMNAGGIEDLRRIILYGEKRWYEA
jgi:mannitol/fructose-specific phosphotransferase system IIA component (Ntr-type)